MKNKVNKIVVVFESWTVNHNRSYRKVADGTATTHIKRQLISGDNSYQFEKATTHIKRQLISYIEIENSYQVLTDANLQSINSSLQERLSQFDCTLVAINTITPNER